MQEQSLLDAAEDHHVLVAETQPQQADTNVPDYYASEGDKSLVEEVAQLENHLRELQNRRRQVHNMRQRQAATRQALMIQLNQASGLDQQEALVQLRSVMYQQVKRRNLLQLTSPLNVLSDCFHISHRGPFGTINGLRLGAEAPSLSHEPQSDSSSTTSSAPSPAPRHPFSLLGSHSNSNTSANATTVTMQSSSSSSAVSEPSSASGNTKVPWVEINAALGHLVLLLSILEQHQKSLFSGSNSSSKPQFRHTLTPLGSFSKIDNYPLYSSEDSSFSLNLFGGKRHFNYALQALVECVQDVSAAIRQHDRSIVLPHELHKEDGLYYVGGCSVQFNTTSAHQQHNGSNKNPAFEWTKAMKYLLTDIKHLLTCRALHVWEFNAERK